MKTSSRIEEGYGSKPVILSKICEKVKSLREIQTGEKKKSECPARLVPLLHKYSLLWTKPRLLKRDVIIQVGKLSSGKVGDKFEALVWVTLGLNMSNQGLKKTKQQDVNEPLLFTK